MKCFEPRPPEHGCARASLVIPAQRPLRVQFKEPCSTSNTVGGEHETAHRSPPAQDLRRIQTYRFEECASAYLDVSCRAAPGTVSKCPCCGTSTMTDAADDCVGFAGMCDNRRWEWRGEPPFCCYCASRKGIGYACIYMNVHRVCAWARIESGASCWRFAL